MLPRRHCPSPPISPQPGDRSQPSTPVSFEHSVLALERALSFSEPVPWLRARLGVMQGPRPVHKSRAATRYRTAGADLRAADEWRRFLADEAARQCEILVAFERADAGTGLLSSFLGNVRTAASLAAELVPPPQGLPSVQADTLALHPWPEQPAPLCTDYLARMPPQALPPGFPATLEWGRVLKA